MIGGSRLARWAPKWFPILLMNLTNVVSLGIRNIRSTTIDIICGQICSGNYIPNNDNKQTSLRLKVCNIEGIGCRTLSAHLGTTRRTRSAKSLDQSPPPRVAFLGSPISPGDAAGLFFVLFKYKFSLGWGEGRCAYPHRMQSSSVEVVPHTSGCDSNKEISASSAAERTRASLLYTIAANRGMI